MRKIGIETQKYIQSLMIHLLKDISSFTNNAYSLKGGTALTLFYGLPRFSEDMDFNSLNSIDLENIILHSVRRFGIKDHYVNYKKGTSTVQRYILHYSLKNENNLMLKLECSFREKDYKTEIIDGCSVVNIKSIIQGKSSAFMSRMLPRDIFDMDYLISNFANQFPSDLIISLDEFIYEKGIDRIAEVMKADIINEQDWILCDVDCENIVLNLENNVSELRRALFEKQ